MRDRLLGKWLRLIGLSMSPSTVRLLTNSREDKKPKCGGGWLARKTMLQHYLLSTPELLITFFYCVADTLILTL